MQAIKDAAIKPNRYGQIGERIEPAAQTPIVKNWRGELDFESEDGKKRYSNPYAARLAEVSEGREFKLPEAPSAPIRRDGVLSVKPQNLKCDFEGRNCKFVGGMIRTLKSDLEARIKRSIPVSHPVLAWMAEHAAWLMTIRPRLDNGRSPYEMARGSNFGRDLLCFGECCLYQVPLGLIKKSLEGKLGPRWGPGIFLGYVKDSHEYAVWDIEE